MGALKPVRIPLRDRPNSPTSGDRFLGRETSALGVLFQRRWAKGEGVFMQSAGEEEEMLRRLRVQGSAAANQRAETEDSEAGVWA
jgi:hypothetical protein